uniref:Uncharacterized protein n=1 Tax=Fagus sylvatica TaxID=28930 RepID=A0A2N9F2J0_FAGSY
MILEWVNLELEIWVFGGFGSLWWWGGFGSLWWWVRGGGLGLGIRWVWVFVVVGAWWWLGFGSFRGFGSLWWWVRGGGLGLGLSVGLGLCGGGPGVVESVAWGGCWVTGSGARPEGGGAVPFGG